MKSSTAIVSTWRKKANEKRKKGKERIFHVSIHIPFGAGSSSSPSPIALSLSPATRFKALVLLPFSLDFISFISIHYSLAKQFGGHGRWRKKIFISLLFTAFIFLIKL